MLNSLWRFATERQRIWERRYAGMPPPWTEDAVLAANRFTNVYRWLDRQSQYLIRHVIGARRMTRRETFKRVILFDIFKRDTTWEILRAYVDSEDWTGMKWALSEARSRGVPIFTQAYMSHGIYGEEKHVSHLDLVAALLRDGVGETIWEMSLMDAVATLRRYHLVGPFLAMQFVTDLGYSAVAKAWSENDDVVAGPGALRGLSRLYGCEITRRDAESDDLVRACWSAECEAKAAFPRVQGIEPSLMDFQNVLCEFDKYCREARTDVFVPRPGARIKQRYRPGTGAGLGVVAVPPGYGARAGGNRPGRRLEPMEGPDLGPGNQDG